MENKNFEEQMEKLDTPQVNDISHQQIVKVNLLNARKSSRIGIAFIVVPCLFLLGVFIKYFLGINLQVFSAFEDAMSNLDKTPFLKWISPLLLVGLPLLGIIFNTLAITHFYRNKQRKELLITIKYRLLNIIVLIISLCIVAVFILFAINENMHHH